MTHLCVYCAYMDGASQIKWQKANAAYVEDEPGGVATPLFDTWKPHCTHESARRQPKTDAVAGIHLDGPPWLSCKKRRENCPVTCRDYIERKSE